FTIVIDNFQTDTADYADLLLPSTMQTEHADLHHAYGHIYLGWNEPAVAAAGECLPHTEIFRRLARRLGVSAPWVYGGADDLPRRCWDRPIPPWPGSPSSASSTRAGGAWRCRRRSCHSPTASRRRRAGCSSSLRR